MYQLSGANLISINTSKLNDTIRSFYLYLQVETTLKTLTLSDYKWRKAWESLQKLTGKVKLLYSYIDGYMSNPNQVSQIGLGIGQIYLSLLFNFKSS